MSSLMAAIDELNILGMTDAKYTTKEAQKNQNKENPWRDENKIDDDFIICDFIAGSVVDAQLSEKRRRYKTVSTLIPWCN